MCPLISPASGALVSAILLLISEWPVFNIIGLPPALAISSNSTWLALTSAMMVAPGWLFSTSRDHSTRSWSPHSTRPLPSIAPMRSPSPSKAMPRSQPCFFTSAMQLLEVLGHRRIGMVRREGAVDLLVQHEMLARQLVDHRADRHADRAVAGIPGDLELLAGLHVLQEPRGIGVEDVLLLDLALRRSPSRPWRRWRRASGSPRRRTTSCPSSS